MIQIALICKEYGWTYDEYMDQPEDFTAAILARRQVEAVVEKEQIDKAGQQ
jgi:hypothetical protein|uniref:Uncharacterized protein n=1 Tax=Myoviridae sp. ctNYa18 TaxID=2825090 RepID=A0A8S5PIF2_9CAUD|nr:MAG TPA: hypothetical protein [Myoviridae sp. ctNYa18]DAR94119.1 MAG TPA: hypothetical protein [Caudoviricetes sp.]